MNGGLLFPAAFTRMTAVSRISITLLCVSPQAGFGPGGHGVTRAAPGFVRPLLREWRLTPDQVRRVAGGSNAHWLIRRGAEAFVLRRYRPGQTGPSIAYEIDVLCHLRSRGWPVAVPIDDVIWHQGSAFALFRRLPGRTLSREGDRQRRRRGRILAELHADLAGVADIGQRAGWQRADEIMLAPGAVTSAPSYLAAAVRAHWDGVRERCAPATTRGLPVLVAHGDVISRNLLFENGELTGVLDLDSTHLDLRAADVACARRSVSDAVVRGYLEVSTLSNVELTCLDDLWRLSVLRYAAQLLAGTATGPAASGLEWCVRQLDKTRPFGDC
jgi:Ser/Thr protein kinase RdoA (MazF antagonist)